MAFCEYQLNSNNGIDAQRHRNEILKEIFRKSIHMCGAFVPLLLKHFYVPTLILLACVLVVYLISELLRFHGKNVPLISAITKVASRKRDENKFVLGPVYLALGILLTACFYESQSAAVGIYALTLGDGLASLVGKLIGQSYLYKMQGKTAEGSLACFLAIFVSSFCVTKSASAALILATVGMFIELLPLKDYDNLIIPLAIATIHQFFLA